MRWGLEFNVHWSKWFPFTFSVTKYYIVKDIYDVLVSHIQRQVDGKHQSKWTCNVVKSWRGKALACEIWDGFRDQCELE